MISSADVEFSGAYNLEFCLPDILTVDESTPFRDHGYVQFAYHLPEELLQALQQGGESVLSIDSGLAQKDIANPHLIPSIDGRCTNPFMPATSFDDQSLVACKRNNSPIDTTHQLHWLDRGKDRPEKSDFPHGQAQWRERYVLGANA